MPIDRILARSEELEAAIVQLLDTDAYPTYGPDRARMQLSVTAASLSFEHARALRFLVAGGLVSSAIPVMRLQFEAVTRSAWLLFAASDEAVAIAAAPLTSESETAARDLLPMAFEMIKQLRKSPLPAAAAPAAMLGRFNDMQRNALNSFVHGGIHVLRRHAEGYPAQLVCQVIECSNALMTIAAMMLAILSGDSLLAGRMNRIHIGFEDCLTPILSSY